MTTNTRLFGSILTIGIAIAISQTPAAQARDWTDDSTVAPGDALWYGEYPAGAYADDAACADCCSPCPRVYGLVEALFLQRTNCSFDQPLLVNLRDPNDPNNVLDPSDAPTAFSTGDFGFGFTPAMRVLLGYRLHNGWALEGGYFGLFDANTSTWVNAGGEPPIYTFPNDPVTGTNVAQGANVFPDMDRVRLNYDSWLHSGELNLVCCQGCCDTYAGKGKEDCGASTCCRTFEWFAGFRYLNFHERMNIYGERDQQVGGGGVMTESGVYNIRTTNNLYGAQLGARVRRWGNRWGWEGTGKAGLFVNDAQQEQYIVDYDNFALRPLTSSSTDHMGFFGELNLTAIYRLNEVWNLRAGYNLMWLSGVALAPNQLDFSAAPDAGNRIASNGSVFLHGVSAGIEARW